MSGSENNPKCPIIFKNSSPKSSILDARSYVGAKSREDGLRAGFSLLPCSEGREEMVVFDSVACYFASSAPMRLCLHLLFTHYFQRGRQPES